MESLYLDDLQPGQRFNSRPQEMDLERMKAFAAEFDPQPFHLDEEAAQASVFKGLAASGWHTASVAMRLLVECMPVAGGLIGFGGELSWPRPTRAGDVLRLEAEVLEVRPSQSKPQQGVVTIRNTTRNQHGETVCVFTAKILAVRRS